MPLTGTVDAHRDAVLHLTVHGPVGVETLDFVVDSGFNGWLLLSAEVAARLGLSPLTASRAALADGTVVRFGVTQVGVDWLGGRRIVYALIAPSPEVLLGTALLAAHQLVIDYPGRRVEIT